ncbi:MAG TPA: hypothetical protein VIM73_13295 [Polyangiaceae bacterium]
MANDDESRAAKPESGSQDVALIHGVTPEGDLRVIRKREDRVELGALRALREGAPIHGEVVRLTPRKEFPLLCDVESAYQPSALPAPQDPPATGPRKGPAQVATEDYRRNWERIWSGRSDHGPPN